MNETTRQQQDSQEMGCPICNAKQPWSDRCRRCKADLSLLQRIWRQAEFQRQKCLRELAAGRPRLALGHARRYAASVGHAKAAPLLAVCSLLGEDWPRAIRSMQAADRNNTG